MGRETLVAGARGVGGVSSSWGVSGVGGGGGGFGRGAAAPPAGTLVAARGAWLEVWRAVPLANQVRDLLKAGRLEEATALAETAGPPPVATLDDEDEYVEDEEDAEDDDDAEDEDDGGEKWCPADHHEEQRRGGVVRVEKSVRPVAFICDCFGHGVPGTLKDARQVSQSSLKKK